MIRLTFVVEEIEPGKIRFRGGGENKGDATAIECEFAERLMEAVAAAKEGFSQDKEVFPLTFYKRKRIEDDNTKTNRGTDKQDGS